jgi:hypothetical protein
VTAPGPAPGEPSGAPSPALERSNDLRLAREYADAAGLHQRRALAAFERGDGQAGEREQATAERYRTRAQCKAFGWVMPAELRTPSESILRVDELRQALAAVLLSYSDLTLKELELFDQAQRDRALAGGPPAIRCEVLENVLASFGVRFAPHASPLPAPDPATRAGAIFSEIRLPTDKAVAVAPPAAPTPR